MSENKSEYKNNLHVSLGVGLNVDGTFVKELSLLRTNGIAEEVFLRRTSDKPYTWIGSVISVATDHIGPVSIGSEVRDEYMKSGSVLIPQTVKQLPLADANSLLVDIHRRVWQNLLPKQEILCKYCAKKLTADVDLDRIDYLEEDKPKVASEMPLEFIVCDLEDGFVLNPLLTKLKKEELTYLKDAVFNRMIFRVPTLGDAIRNEKHATDSILFWRRMAQDCLVKLQSYDSNKKEVRTEFPEDLFISLGLDLYKAYMSQNDLRIVRKGLREELPTLPFAYFDECPCPEKREIPYVMEASSFFSE